MGAKPQDDIFTFLHTIDFLVFFVFPQQCLFSATLLTSFPYISNFYYLTLLYYALSFYSSISLSVRVCFTLLFSPQTFYIRSPFNLSSIIRPFYNFPAIIFI